uniref:Hexosyltransferase n=1 Tax=Parasteatoda tepidariorum TaxID=114398 RepID=A0A2L2YSE1_PARTP
MRRLWCAKCIVSLLVSVALTFHLLRMGTNEQTLDKPSTYALELEDSKSIDIPPTSHSFTKSIPYLRRKLSQGNTVTARETLTPKWIVLAGNVTVHEGTKYVPNYVSFDVNSPYLCANFYEYKTKLLIFVASSANHFEQRQAIRETWGLKLLQQAYNYRVVFLLGKTKESEQQLMTQESYRYGALVQINLTESFRNLGRKSVAGLQWTKQFCKQADFIMKTDDDILVHVPNLLKALEGAEKTDPLLMCHENRMRQILRKELLDSASIPPTYHKYEVSENELPGKYYPPYCSGMAYVFSSTVRDWLLEASATTPIFFIEDVYLTGFCRHKAGVIIKPHSGITLRPPIDFHQAACTFRDGRISSQEVGVKELRKLWVETNTQGFFCPQLLGYAKDRKEFE